MLTDHTPVPLKVKVDAEKLIASLSSRKEVYLFGRTHLPILTCLAAQAPRAQHSLQAHTAPARAMVALLP